MNFINFKNFHSSVKSLSKSCVSDNNAQRYVFNGTKANPMFNLETVNIPEISDGEVLVKVRTATICLSDIHTVCGNRIEPTPRWK